MPSGNFRLLFILNISEFSTVFMEMDLAWNLLNKIVVKPLSRMEGI